MLGMVEVVALGKQGFVDWLFGKIDELQTEVPGQHPVELHGLHPAHGQDDVAEARSPACLLDQRLADLRYVDQAGVDQHLPNTQIAFMRAGSSGARNPVSRHGAAQKFFHRPIRKE